MAKCQVSADAFKHKHHFDSAGGTRVVFLLGSLASLPSEEVVERESVSLSDDDTHILSRGLSLPPQRWTDLDVVLARYAQDKDVYMGPRVIFTEENDVSCDLVLSKLRDFLRASADKDGGMQAYCIA